MSKWRMGATLRGTLVPLAVCGVVATSSVCGVVATLSMAVAMTQRDTAVATTVADAAMPATAAAIPVAVLPIGDNGIAEPLGANPDPEAFDRAGLEWWWRNYQRSHPQTAAP